MGLKKVISRGYRMYPSVVHVFSHPELARETGRAEHGSLDAHNDADCTLCGVKSFSW